MNPEVNTTFVPMKSGTKRREQTPEEIAKLAAKRTMRAEKRLRWIASNGTRQTAATTPNPVFKRAKGVKVDEKTGLPFNLDKRKRAA